MLYARLRSCHVELLTSSDKAFFFTHIVSQERKEFTKPDPPPFPFLVERDKLNLETEHSRIHSGV